LARIDARDRRLLENIVENAMCCALANVLASNVFRAGPHAFARAWRESERRKPAW
jgi:hypothetical protein